MYKFTKGREMKQLEELWNGGKIKKVFVRLGRQGDHEIVGFDSEVETVSLDGFGYFFGSFGNGSINWEETAKLVKSESQLMGNGIKKAHEGIGWSLEEASAHCRVNKEDKVEKIIVRGWEDLRNNELIYSNTTNAESVPYISCGFSRGEQIKMIQRKDNIINMVECLNILGGNFEYKKAKIIIDTDKLLVSMLINFSNEQIYYDFYNKLFFTNNETSRRENISFDEVEERFNVDLQILK